jgi:hypothetical protein
MAEIYRYALVDLDNTEGDVEYETLDQAQEAADDEHGIVRITYIYEDSELVWTPDGADVWPPVPDFEQQEAHA